MFRDLLPMIEAWVDLSFVGSPVATAGRAVTVSGTGVGLVFCQHLMFVCVWKHVSECC